MYIKRRTTIELDEALLARAKRALGGKTTRATVEEALRRVTHQAETEHDRRREEQLGYLALVRDLADLEVLGSEEMWR